MTRLAGLSLLLAGWMAVPLAPALAIQPLNQRFRSHSVH